MSKVLKVVISGGCVQHVLGLEDGQSIIIRDYDVDHKDWEQGVKQDSEGDYYQEIVFKREGDYLTNPECYGSPYKERPKDRL